MADPAPPPRRSALAAMLTEGDLGAAGPDGPGVRLGERHPLALVQIEAGADDIAAMLTAAATVLGRAPPGGFNQAVSVGRTRLIWAGPNRWWVAEPESRPLYHLLREGLAASGAAVVDLSSARTCLRLSGRDAGRVLAKGCGLDLHPGAFAVDRCAQTSLFHIPVLIDRRAGDAGFDLYAARGLALSLWESLTDAAAEYGCRIAGKDGSGE